MTTIFDCAEIGPIIRDARKAKRWTTRELAERAYVSSGYITLIENGHRDASLGVILNIFVALNLGLQVVKR